MPSVQALAHLPATAEDIFSFLDDYHNIPRVQPQFTAVRLVSQAKRGAGATVELVGTFRGMPVRVHSRIITYSPPTRLVSITEGTILSRSAWEIEPAVGAHTTTRVTLKVDYKVGGPLGKLFTGVASSLFNKEIQAMTNESLRRLQEVFSPGS